MSRKNAQNYIDIGDRNDISGIYRQSRYLSVNLLECIFHLKSTNHIDQVHDRNQNIPLDSCQLRKNTDIDDQRNINGQKEKNYHGIYCGIDRLNRDKMKQKVKE